MDAIDQKVSAVVCPGCNRAMKEVEQKPILLSHGLCDVTFECETCQMHTVRTMKRDLAKRVKTGAVPLSERGSA